MANGNYMTTGSFVEQLKEKHPNWKKASGEWYDDETIYAMGRDKYPNAPVVDWAEAGYTPSKKTSEEDSFEKYRDRTSESNFLDYLDWGLGDENDWFVTRLAYQRSLQGLADTALRGEERFSFNREPKLWEEAIGGALSFFFPLDIATMVTGGGLGKFATYGMRSSRAAGQLVQRGWADWTSRKLVEKGMKRDLADNGIGALMAQEFTIAPYEAAKANLRARTAHITDPQGHPKPLSSTEIWDETLAGAGHGLILGAAIGVPQAYLGTLHSRALFGLEKELLKKSIHTPRSLAAQKSFNQHIKYTGKLGQFATEFASLNIADYGAQGVIDNHWKSWEQLGRDAVITAGMLGAIKGTHATISNTLGHMVEKSRVAYQESTKAKIKEMDLNQKVKKNIRDKSKDQKDNELEKDSSEKAGEETSEFSDDIQLLKDFRKSDEFKQLEDVKKNLEEFERDLAKEKRLGVRKVGLEDILEQVRKQKVIALEINQHSKNSGYEGWFQDVNKVEKALTKLEDTLVKEISNIPKSKAARLSVVKQQLKDAEFDTIELDTGKKIKVDNLKLTHLEHAQNVLQDYQSGGAPGRSPKLTPAEKTVAAEALKPDELADIHKKGAEYNKENNPDLETSAARMSNKIKEIDSEVSKVNRDKNVSKEQKEIHSAGMQLVKTFLSNELVYKTQKKGTAAGGPLEYLLTPTSQIKYADGLTKFINFLSKGPKKYKPTDVPKNVLQSYLKGLKDASEKSGMAKFYEWLDMRDLTVGEIKGLGLAKKIFGVKKTGVRVAPTGLKGSDIGNIKVTDTIDTPADYIAIMPKAQREKTVTFAKGSYLKKFGGFLGNILKKAKEYSDKNPAKDTTTGDKLDNIFIFKDKGEVKVVSQKVFNSFVKRIFGGKKTGMDFRKGLSTYIYEKYGGDSKQFAIVDLVGLGHKKVKALTDVQSKYVATLKSNKTLLPEFQKLQNEFMQLVFDGKKSTDLAKMSNKQLKKYGISKEVMTHEGGFSTFELKRGFEVLEKFLKAKDKNGMINIGKDISINENVLRGMFRFMTETSARPGEVFVPDAQAKGLGIPARTSEIGAAKIRKVLMDIAKKQESEGGLSSRDIGDLIEMQWFIPVAGEPSTKWAKGFIPNIAYKINATSADTPISMRQKVGMKLGLQNVTIKGKDVLFSRAAIQRHVGSKTKGSVEYETMLERLYKGLGWGEEMVDTSKKLGQQRFTLTKLGQGEITELFDILNHKKRGPELLSKLNDNPHAADIIKLKMIRDKHEIPTEDSIKLLKALGVKDGDINNLTSSRTAKIVSQFYKKYPESQDPRHETTTELLMLVGQKGESYLQKFGFFKKMVLPIWYVMRESGPSGRKVANMLLEFDIVYTRDKAFADVAIASIKRVLKEEAGHTKFIDKELRTQKGRVLSANEKASIAAFDKINPKTKKKWSSEDKGFDKLSDYQRNHVVAREWHNQMTEYYWDRTKNEHKLKLSDADYAKWLKDFNKKYLSNYMTRALSPQVVRSIDKNGKYSKFIQDFVDGEMRHAARTEAALKFKKGSDAYKAEVEKLLKDESGEFREKVVSEAYDILTNQPHRIDNVYFKERGVMLPFEIEIQTRFGRTKKVESYASDYNAIMDRYSTVTSKFISTVKYFPEYTTIGSKYGKGGDAKKLWNDLVTEGGDSGKYAAQSLAAILGLNETITGVHKNWAGLHRWLGAATTLSAATGLSSPTSGVKNVLIGLPRAMGTFGVINTAKGVMQLFDNYSVEMSKARKLGYYQFANKNLQLAEKKPAGIFKHVPYLKDFSMEKVFDFNLMTKGEGWLRVTSQIAGNLTFDQSLNAWHGQRNVFYGTSKKNIEKMWRDVWKLSDKEVSLIKNKSNFKRLQKGKSDGEIMGLYDMIHAKVTHYSHISTQGGTSPQLLPLWMSSRWARPATLFYRMAASNTHDMYLNHIKPIKDHGNIMPLARATIASSVSGYALWGLYELLFDVKNPTQYEDSRFKQTISYLWRAEYLQLFSLLINPYGSWPFFKGKHGPLYGGVPGFGKEKKLEAHRMFSQFNPAYGTAVARNVMSASSNFFKWDPLTRAGKAVGMDWGQSSDDPHLTGKQAMDNFLKETLVIYSQLRKNIAISPSVYAQDKLFKAQKEFQTFASVWRRNNGYEIDRERQTHHKTPYFTRLKDAFYANDEKEFIKSYWATYNYLYTSLMKDTNHGQTQNVAELHKKVVRSINGTLNSISLSGLSRAYNKVDKLVPEQEFIKFLGKDAKRYLKLRDEFEYRLRLLRRYATHRDNELKNSLIYDRRLK